MLQRLPKLKKLPKAKLKPPRDFKKPNVEDLKSDMQRLGEDIAEGFKNKIIDNIETNAFGFVLKEATIKRKGNNLPLVDTRQMLDAIFREGTVVSVRDTQRTEDSLTNKDLAVIHEYGALDKGIPPRPVWRLTHEAYKEVTRDRIKKFLKTHKF